jgi:broad specificity phosphatase PhoE
VAVPSILLIRHGQASYGTEDYDRLSPRGVEQAEMTAGSLALRGLAPGRVISGSLRRQVDTAAPAAAAFGLAPETDPRWNEYSMDDIIAAHHHPRSDAATEQSQLSSSAFQDILEAALAGWMAAGETTDASESWPAFGARVSAALHELAGELDSGSTAVVFTSGGVIAAVCAELLELGTSQLILLNRVAVNTAITKIAAGRRGLSLISFNDHAHLEGTGLITYR